MTRMDDMKMDFLLHIQTNQYDIAFEISQQILEIDPKNALILKFSKFLHEYKGKIKEMDSQKNQKVVTIIEEDLNPKCDSETESDFSISGSDDSSDDEGYFKKPQLAVNKAKEIAKEKPKQVTGGKLGTTIVKKK